MKHLFIINPIAGKGSSVKLIPEIRKLFEGRKEEYVIEVTERPGHATEIAAKHASSDNLRVYSVGGDGTLNEIVNGMAGSSCSLAVIPAGSGNDFSRSLEEGDDAAEVLRKTVDGVEKRIDLASVNGKYFINIASVGFDAEVVHNTEAFKKLPLITGSFAYILGILSTILRYKNNYISLNIDGTTLETAVLLVAVANGRYYGGGMLAAPEAIVDDGLFDICIVKRMKRPKVLTLFPEFMKGRHASIEEVSFRRGKRVEISSANELLLNIDGEIVKTKKAVFEIIPRGISVTVPSGSA